MDYCIHHVTRFRYRGAVSESVMEVRLHPRCEGSQECVDFELILEPTARQFEHRDYLGNIIHSFDIPGGHRQLTITAAISSPDEPAAGAAGVSRPGGLG